MRAASRSARMDASTGTTSPSPIRWERARVEGKKRCENAATPLAVEAMENTLCGSCRLRHPAGFSEEKNRRSAHADRREPNPIQKSTRLIARRIPADTGRPFCLHHEGEGEWEIQKKYHQILYFAWLEVQQALYQALPFRPSQTPGPTPPTPNARGVLFATDTVQNQAEGVSSYYWHLFPQMCQ